MAGGGGGGGPTPSRKGKFSSPVAIKKARIEIIPLIDVMFFLLAAFMMVSLSMQKAQTVKMDLPASTVAVEDFKPDILNVGIEKGGDISIGTNRVELAKLDDELVKAFKKSTNTPVFVTGDRMATHGSVAVVLDRIRRAGFQKISFVTAHAGEGAAPAPAASPQP
jgi:biopolymer transport protein ExbD